MTGICTFVSCTCSRHVVVRARKTGALLPVRPVGRTDADPAGQANQCQAIAKSLDDIPNSDHHRSTPTTRDLSTHPSPLSTTRSLTLPSSLSQRCSCNAPLWPWLEELLPHPFCDAPSRPLSSAVSLSACCLRLRWMRPGQLAPSSYQPWCLAGLVPNRTSTAAIWSREYRH